MDYNQIAIFVSIIEAGSLSEAARRSNVAKSNLSRALTALEKNIGTQLIYRNTRSFHPTEAGMNFYNQCKGPLFDIKIAAESIKQNATALKGKFIITVAVDVAHTLLPQIISDFSRAYPKINIEVRGEDRTIDLVKDGVDLALRIGSLSDSGLKAKKISDISLILVSTNQYLNSFVKIRNINQLKDHRMVSFNKKYEKGFTLMKRNIKTQKVKISTVLEANNPLIAKLFVLSGQGIALLPDIICYEDLKSGKLVRVLPEYSTKPIPFHFVWPAHTAESPKVRAFIDYSKDILRQYFNLSAMNS